MKKFAPPTKAETRKAIDRLLEIEAKRRGTKPTCEMCRFWEAHVNPDDIGFCLRFPPNHQIAGNPTGDWPETDRNDRCGEFESKENP